jgi:hypothetical protein
MTCLGPIKGTIVRCGLQKGHKGICKPPNAVEPRDERREMVNHPRHYGGDTPHEVIKCLFAWGLEKDALLWNAVKYVARAALKGNMLEDLKKARFYLDRRIGELESLAKSPEK